MVEKMQILQKSTPGEDFPPWLWVCASVSASVQSFIIRDTILYRGGEKSCRFCRIKPGRGGDLIVALMRRGEDDERDTGINRCRKWGTGVMLTSVTQFLAEKREITIWSSSKKSTRFQLFLANLVWDCSGLYSIVFINRKTIYRQSSFIMWWPGKKFML